MGESPQEAALSDSLHLPDARLLSLQELRVGAWALMMEEIMIMEDLLIIITKNNNNKGDNHDYLLMGFF